MKNVVIKYGLISGAIASALLVIAALIYKGGGLNYGMVIGFTSMILSFLIIYPAMASYRDKVGGGQISYGRALSIGLLITLIAAVCYSLTWMVICKTIYPDFMEQYAAFAIGKLKESGADAAKINEQLAEMNRYKSMYENLITMFLITCTEPLPIGVAMSVICGIIVRMKKPVAA